MAERNLATALAFLAVVVGALLVVPTLLFPRTTCLTAGPHVARCEVGRLPTLLVVGTAAVGLLLAVRRVDPE